MRLLAKGSQVLPHVASEGRKDLLTFLSLKIIMFFNPYSLKHSIPTSDVEFLPLCTSCNWVWSSLWHCVVITRFLIVFLRKRDEALVVFKGGGRGELGAVNHQQPRRRNCQVPRVKPLAHNFHLSTWFSCWLLILQHRFSLTLWGPANW